MYLAYSSTLCMKIYLFKIIKCFTHFICSYVSVFFHLGKKCKFEISENQFFCPKIVIFAFYGIKLRTKTGLVALWNITSLRRAILNSILRKSLSCEFSFWEIARTFFKFLIFSILSKIPEFFKSGLRSTWGWTIPLEITLKIK